MIGERIRELRIKNKYTMEEFSEKNQCFSPNFVKMETWRNSAGY